MNHPYAIVFLQFYWETTRTSGPHWIEQTFDQVIQSSLYDGTGIEAEWSYEQKKGNDCKKHTDPKHAHTCAHIF